MDTPSIDKKQKQEASGPTVSVSPTLSSPSSSSPSLSPSSSSITSSVSSSKNPAGLYLHHILFIDNTNTDAIEKELPPVQNNFQLDTMKDSSPKSVRCSAPHQKRQSFESSVEELKTYIVKNGHIDVKKKENKSLHKWIANIKQSYNRIQEGRPYLIKLTPERIKMLQDIGFDFKSKRDRPSISRLPSSVHNDSSHKHQKVHHIIPKESSMVVWLKSLNLDFTFAEPLLPENRHTIDSVNDSNENEQHLPLVQNDPSPAIVHTSLPQSVRSRVPHKRRCQSFESSVEELKMYIEKHGHMKVNMKENKSLHLWIRNIKTSYKRIQEGKAPIIKLTPDRMRLLQDAGFDFENIYQWSRQMYSRQGEHKQTPKVSKLIAVHQDEEDEEILGDIIPRWLIDNEEEEDKDDLLLDEAGGTEFEMNVCNSQKSRRDDNHLLNIEEENIIIDIEDSEEEGSSVGEGEGDNSADCDKKDNDELRGETTPSWLFHAYDDYDDDDDNNSTCASQNSQSSNIDKNIEVVSGIQAESQEQGQDMGETTPAWLIDEAEDDTDSEDENPY